MLRGLRLDGVDGVMADAAGLYESIDVALPVAESAEGQAMISEYLAMTGQAEVGEAPPTPQAVFTSSLMSPIAETEELSWPGYGEPPAPVAAIEDVVLAEELMGGLRPRRK